MRRIVGSVEQIFELGADQKSRLFRRLTILQCRIAQFDNLMRLPLIIKLFYYNNNNGILQVCGYVDLGKFKLFEVSVAFFMRSLFID